MQQPSAPQSGTKMAAGGWLAVISSPLLRQVCADVDFLGLETHAQLSRTTTCVPRKIQSGSEGGGGVGGKTGRRGEGWEARVDVCLFVGCYCCCCCLLLLFCFGLLVCLLTFTFFVFCLSVFYSSVKITLRELTFYSQFQWGEEKKKEKEKKRKIKIFNDFILFIFNFLIIVIIFSF